MKFAFQLVFKEKLYYIITLLQNITLKRRSKKFYNLNHTRYKRLLSKELH